MAPQVNNQNLEKTPTINLEDVLTYYDNCILSSNVYLFISGIYNTFDINILIQLWKFAFCKISQILKKMVLRTTDFFQKLILSTLECALSSKIKKMIGNQAFSWRFLAFFKKKYPCFYTLFRSKDKKQAKPEINIHFLPHIISSLIFFMILSIPNRFQWFSGT